MRKFSLALLVLTSATGVAGADEPKPVKAELSWRITLDEQGHVTQIDAAGKQPVDKVPQIRARLEKEIRGWQFTSGKLDGRPATTETGLHAWITLEPQHDDTVIIHVDKATTGASIAHIVPPRYPPYAVADHITGLVVLRIGYDASGKVTSVEPEPGAPKASNVLVQSAVRAAQSWTFQPERVGGYTRNGFAITPLCYRLTNLTTLRTQGKCDWKRPDSAESVAEGEALALDPAARLLSDVAGRAL